MRLRHATSLDVTAPPLSGGSYGDGTTPGRGGGLDGSSGYANWTGGYRVRAANAATFWREDGYGRDFWKYATTATSTPPDGSWADPSFDDSSWRGGPAPHGWVAVNGWWAPHTYLEAANFVWLRRRIYVPNTNTTIDVWPVAYGPADAEVKATVWLDGTLVGDTGTTTYPVTAMTTASVSPGTHWLAVKWEPQNGSSDVFALAWSSA